MMKMKSVLLCIGLLFCWCSMAAAESVTITNVENYVKATRITNGSEFTASQTSAFNVLVESPYTSSEAAGTRAIVYEATASVFEWYVDASPCTLYAFASETWTFTAANSQLLLDVNVVGTVGSEIPENDRVAAWEIKLFEKNTGNAVAIYSTDVVSLVPTVDDVWNGTAALTPGVEYYMLLSVEIGGFFESHPLEGYSLTPTLTYDTRPPGTVPEPATMLLLGLGLIGLAGIRKKLS